MIIETFLIIANYPPAVDSLMEMRCLLVLASLVLCSAGDLQQAFPSPEVGKRTISNYRLTFKPNRNDDPLATIENFETGYIIKFDLMVEEFPKRKNKKSIIHFSHREGGDKSRTPAVFLKGKTLEFWRKNEKLTPIQGRGNLLKLEMGAWNNIEISELEVFQEDGGLEVFYQVVVSGEQIYSRMLRDDEILERTVPVDLFVGGPWRSPAKASLKNLQIFSQKPLIPPPPAETTDSIEGTMSTQAVTGTEQLSTTATVSEEKSTEELVITPRGDLGEESEEFNQVDDGLDIAQGKTRRTATIMYLLFDCPSDAGGKGGAGCGRGGAGGRLCASGVAVEAGPAPCHAPPRPAGRDGDRADRTAGQAGGEPLLHHGDGRQDHFHHLQHLR